MKKPKTIKTADTVATPRPKDDPLAAAENMFNMLKEAGAEDIEDLNPANYRFAPPQPMPEISENDRFLAALDRYEDLLKTQLELLKRFEGIIRHLESQQAPKPQAAPRPFDSGVIETPRQDVGTVWAQGLRDKPLGTD